MLKVFVACPYVPEPIADYRKAFRDIASSEPLVQFVFADERISNNMILDKIKGYIDDSQMVICDVTGWNPNVCLEFGLAIGLGKQVHIFYRKPKAPSFLDKAVGRVEKSELPMDMRGYDRVDYEEHSSLRAGLLRLVQQELRRPDESTAKEATRMMREKVLGIIELNPGKKGWEIAKDLGVEPADVRPALDWLLKQKRIERRNKYQNTCYYVEGRAPAPLKLTSAVSGIVEGELPNLDEGERSISARSSG